MHHDLAHIVVYNRLKASVLRIFISDAGVCHTLETDFGCQLKNIWSVSHSLSSFFKLFYVITAIEPQNTDIAETVQPLPITFI